MKIFFFHMLIVIAGCAILQDTDPKSVKSDLTSKVGSSVEKNNVGLSSLASKDKADRVLRQHKRKLDDEESQSTNNNVADASSESASNNGDVSSASYSESSSEDASLDYTPNLYGSTLTPDTEDTVKDLINEFLDWEYDAIDGEKTISQDDIQVINGYLTTINNDLQDEDNYGTDKPYYISPEFTDVLETITNNVTEWQNQIPDDETSLVITEDDIEPLLEALILDESQDDNGVDYSDSVDATRVKKARRARKARKAVRVRKAKKAQRVRRVRKMRSSSNFNSQAKRHASSIRRRSRRNSLAKHHNNRRSRVNRRNSLNKRRMSLKNDASFKFKRYNKMNRRTQTLATSTQSGDYYVGAAANYTTIPDLIVTMEGISTIYNLMNSNVPSQSDANQSTLDQIASSIQTYAKLRNFAIALTANQDKLVSELTYVKSNLSTVQLSTDEVLAFYDYQDRYDDLLLKSLSLSALFIEKQKLLQNECANFTNNTQTISNSIDYLLYVNDAVTQKTQYLRDSPDLGDPTSVQYLQKVDQTILLIPVLIDMQTDVQASLSKIQSGFYAIRDTRSSLNSILTDMELIVAGKYVASNSTTGAKFASKMVGVSLAVLIMGLFL